MKSPNDPHIRGKYFVIKKQYRKSLKTNKKTFEVNNLKTLQSLKHSPKEFWTHLKKLNSHKNNLAHGGQISADNWVTHFSHINSKDPALIPANFNHCNKVKSAIEELMHVNSSNPECPFLDANFTKGGIISGIKRLKKGKATAFDATTNDILRAAKDIIAQTLTNVFNKLAFFSAFLQTMDDRARSPYLQKWG